MKKFSLIAGAGFWLAMALAVNASAEAPKDSCMEELSSAKKQCRARFATDNVERARCELDAEQNSWKCLSVKSKEQLSENECLASAKARTFVCAEFIKKNNGAKAVDCLLEKDRNLESCSNKGFAKGSCEDQREKTQIACMKRHPVDREQASSADFLSCMARVKIDCETTKKAGGNPALN